MKGLGPNEGFGQGVRVRVSSGRMQSSYFTLIEAMASLVFSISAAAASWLVLTRVLTSS